MIIRILFAPIKVKEMYVVFKDPFYGFQDDKNQSIFVQLQKKAQKTRCKLCKKSDEISFSIVKFYKRKGMGATEKNKKVMTVK